MTGDEETIGLVPPAAGTVAGCVACYSSEGIYPPNLDYLKERYGVQVDETRYTVMYDVFADNLMPDITVLVNVS